MKTGGEIETDADHIARTLELCDNGRIPHASGEL